METPEDNIDLRHAWHQVNFGLSDVILVYSDLENPPSRKYQLFFFFFIFIKNPEDDIGKCRPGKWVHLALSSMSYSCSATSKTPELRLPIVSFYIFKKTPGDDIEL